MSYYELIPGSIDQYSSDDFTPGSNSSLSADEDCVDVKEQIIEKDPAEVHTFQIGFNEHLSLSDGNVPCTEQVCTAPGQCMFPTMCDGNVPCTEQVCTAPGQCMSGPLCENKYSSQIVYHVASTDCLLTGVQLPNVNRDTTCGIPTLENPSQGRVERKTRKRTPKGGRAKHEPGVHGNNMMRTAESIKPDMEWIHSCSQCLFRYIQGEKLTLKRLIMVLPCLVPLEDLAISPDEEGLDNQLPRQLPRKWGIAGETPVRGGKDNMFFCAITSRMKVGNQSLSLTALI